MSLNGLEDPAVKEAHETALSEPGGWFLLKYASRDAVGLLGRGTNGIVEMRNAITQYEDTSPLYGFLRYRRRSVIIKYLPDKCSRLVQVRTTVHFNSICEYFTHNTTFAISAAKELKDTKLSAACSLHTASSSTSSSTSSLRRRRLMEIAEEEEEDQRASKRQSTLKEEERPGTENGESPESTMQPPPVTLNSQLAMSAEESKFSSVTEPPPFLGAERPPSPSMSLDYRRLSSQLSRSELYSYSSYPYGKPKVKLGPRPSLDVGGRPRTSAGIGSYRPVSSIPAGFKLFSKGSKRGKDSRKANTDSLPATDDGKENDFQSTATDVATPSDTAADTRDMDRPYLSGNRPVTSSGVSVKSVATAVAASAAKHNTMTPEKARLMKAMKLRERKKMSIQPPLPAPVVDISGVSVEHKDTKQFVILEDDVSAVVATPASVDKFGSHSDSPDCPGDSSQPGVQSADSAIDVGLHPADQASVDTKTTDSHPASPVAISCEIDDSTKASSFSESTDETVQAPQDPKTYENANGVEAHEGEPLHDIDGETSRETEPDDEKHEKNGNDQYGKRGQGGVGVQQTDNRDDLPVESLCNTSFSGTNENDMASQTNITKEMQPELSGRAAIVQDSETTQTSLSDVELVNNTPPAALPTIEEPESRESPPTISFDNNDAASAEAKRSRRRALVDPIRTDLGHALDKDTLRSETNLSDDEDLMEELQSATVLEAKPMTVSKSPVNPVFPHVLKQQDSPTKGAPRLAARTVSNPIRGPLLAPGDITVSSARSVSSGAAFLHKMAQSPSNLAGKKTNLGSSISQRIKALEKLSGGTSTGGESSARLERPSSTFFSVRKASGHEPSTSPSVAERASYLVGEKTPSPPNSRESSSPEMSKVTSRDRSGSMASRLSVFEGGNLPRGRPESIQVKARIIRDPAQPFPKLPELRSDHSEFSTLDLKQSPLVVDHQKATSPLMAFRPPSATPIPAVLEVSEPASRRESIQERRMSREKRRSRSQDRSITGDRDDAEDMRPRRRSSLSIVRDFIKDRRGSVMGGRSSSTDNLNLNNLIYPISPPSRPPSVHTTTGLARRLSISSRRSSISKDRDFSTPPLATPLSPSASGSGDESKSSSSELGHKSTGSGSKNRATRFMKRLSSSLSSGRKTATPMISPTVAEEEETFSPIPTSSGSSATVQANSISYLGDVNVQFPDNLLWKRRTVCLDSQGFLILSAVQGMAATSNAASFSHGERPAGGIKRYHLSDFRSPYIPEMEMQELPHSVCLDFIDGSGLQLACEDRSGQMNILQVLQEAHQNHTSFGQ